MQISLFKVNGGVLTKAALPLTNCVDSPIVVPLINEAGGRNKFNCSGSQMHDHYKMWVICQITSANKYGKPYSCK